MSAHAEVAAGIAKQFGRNSLALIEAIEHALWATERAAVAKLEADIRFLARRAERAGRFEHNWRRDWGRSSNSLVSLAYAVGEQELPSDWDDHAACVRTVRRLPRHRRTRKVLAALREARLYVCERYPIADRRRRWHDFRREAAAVYPAGVPKRYPAGHRRRR